MKQLAFILSVFYVMHAFGQDDSALVYTAVVTVDSQSQNQLFGRAREWFVETYKDPESVLKINDKESGELSGKGAIQYTGHTGMSGGATLSGWIHYNIKLYVKDGRYKYRIWNFTHTGSPTARGFFTLPTDMGVITTDSICPAELRRSWQGEGFWNKTWYELQTLCKKEALALIASLKLAMAKPSAENADW